MESNDCVKPEYISGNKAIDLYLTMFLVGTNTLHILGVVFHSVQQKICSEVGHPTSTLNSLITNYSLPVMYL